MPWSEVPFRFPWSPTLPSELAPDGVSVPVSAAESAGRRAWRTAVADESAPSGVGRAGHGVTGMSISTVDPPVARRVATRILQHVLPPRGARSTIGFGRASRIRRSQRPFTLSVRLLRWCQNAGPVERGPATALRVRHLLPPWQAFLRGRDCVAGIASRGCSAAFRGLECTWAWGAVPTSRDTVFGGLGKHRILWADSYAPWLPGH